MGIPKSTIIDVTLQTLQLGISVALVAGTLGLLMSWLVSRTELPGKDRLSSFLTVPYALPPFLLAMAWIVLGNPQVGLLKDLLPEGGSYGFLGMTFVLASVAFAFPFMELKAGFSRLDPALEEAARMSGATPFMVFRHISLPLLWPSLLNGMILSFLFSIAAFGVPALLGLPVRKMVLTTLIYSQIRVGGLNGIQEGLVLSLILLAIAFAILLLSYFLSRLQKKKFGAIAGTKSSRPSLISLGKLKWPLSIMSWSFFFITVVLPWGALLISALAPVAGKYHPSDWTLNNLFNVLTMGEFQEALGNSILLTLLISLLIVFNGFILGYLSERKKKKWAGLLIEVFTIPFSTPGTVIALVLIIAFTWFSQIGLPLDHPLILMGFAYFLKFSAVGAKQIANSFKQVHPVMEEAARISGARGFTLIKTIWIPLLKKNLLAAFLLAALPMFTELTMSVLLTGPGSATLGTVLFQLQEYADQPSAAALAFLLLTIALGVSFFTKGSKGSNA